MFHTFCNVASVVLCIGGVFLLDVFLVACGFWWLLVAFGFFCFCFFGGFFCFCFFVGSWWLLLAFVAFGFACFYGYHAGAYKAVLLTVARVAHALCCCEWPAYRAVLLTSNQLPLLLLAFGFLESYKNAKKTHTHNQQETQNTVNPQPFLSFCLLVRAA